jgi:predicted transcriptional regulator
LKCFRLLRLILGISQETAAKELGITTMALNNYEAGRRFPSRYLCKKMDDGLIELIDRRSHRGACAGSMTAGSTG